MRPLAVLIGIVLGSTASLALGLTMTWIVLLFLPEHAEVFAAERAPLAQAIGLFAASAAAAGVSFWSELQNQRWRLVAHFVLLALLGLAVVVYWPRR